jgi:hypothetical protein
LSGGRTADAFADGLALPATPALDVALALPVDAALALGPALAEEGAEGVPLTLAGVVAVVADPALVPTPGGIALAAGATKSNPSMPSHEGWRQMMTAMPTAVTRSSIAMNAASFCTVDGPRLRTTTVGFFGRLGRSGMRIVG